MIDNLEGDGEDAGRPLEGQGPVTAEEDAADDVLQAMFFHAEKKSGQVRDMILGGDPLRVVAIEITHRIHDIESTVRYELEGGEPVEVWDVDGTVHIIPKSDAEAGRFPWRE